MKIYACGDLKMQSCYVTLILILNKGLAPRHHPTPANLYSACSRVNKTSEIHPISPNYPFLQLGTGMY